jgi:sortase (surface protein transpeptidase)
VVVKPTVVRKTVVKAATATRYAGTNHLWIPSLGISHSVASFACTRSAPPTAGVYRWGCAGRNNAYLFGHAWSTLKPLHDAYVAGRLHTGMVAYYADGSGRVRAYRVTQIKVVTPDQVAWAIAAQSTPSLTLQTCVGSNSQYRLLVRLVATS